jgi:hypothetical protein
VTRSEFESLVATDKRDKELNPEETVALWDRFIISGILQPAADEQEGKLPENVDPSYRIRGGVEANIAQHFPFYRHGLGYVTEIE